MSKATPSPRPSRKERSVPGNHPASLVSVAIGVALGRPAAAGSLHGEEPSQPQRSTKQLFLTLGLDASVIALAQAE